MAEWEDYLVGGNDILGDKYNVTSGDELSIVEKNNVIKKLSILYQNGIKGNFDVEHLINIHTFLFKETYEYAGIKYMDIIKDKEELSNLLNEMNNRNINPDVKFNLASYLSEYYFKLIKFHPFREGNGRTIREFIRELVLVKFPNYELDYSLMDIRNFKLGIVDYKEFPSMLSYEMYKALIEKEKYENSSYNRIS